jgi:hypothetical protein
MPHRFGLVKYPIKNIALEVIGGYATEEEKKVIHAAGWSEGDLPQLPKFSEEFLERCSEAVEHFYPPKGSDIFGLHTKAEESGCKRVIRRAFKAAKIPLPPRVRVGNPMELL